MRAVKLNLKSNAYGELCASTTILTIFTNSELSDFVNMFFDITSRKNLYDYTADCNNGNNVANFLKEKLGYTDEQLVVVSPEVISYYF